MNRKFRYVNPQELKKRTWMLGIAVAITAVHFTVQYAITKEWLLLALGIIFIVLLPIMVFGRVENRSRSATISMWVMAFLVSAFYFWIGSWVGAIATLITIIALLISCIFIYKR